MSGGAVIVELPGEPRGWARVRVRVVVPKQGKPFPNFFEDEKTRTFKKALAWKATAAMRGRAPLSGPLRVTVVAMLSVPKSWSRKDRDAALAGLIRPTGKPDWDNFGKLGDAFNGLIWNDDAQIVDGRVLKFYSESPQFRVEVCPIEAALFSPAAEEESREPVSDCG